MSHFTVLVIGDDVDKQLAPFHEFECTGTDNEYVQDVDKTEELRTEFEASTTLRYRDTEGTLHDPYEDRFYRDPTPEETAKHRPMGMGFGGGISWSSRDWGDGQGYRPKVHYTPDGWEEVRVATSELKTFAAFVEEWNGLKPVASENEIDLKGDHKYGYTLMDGDRVVKCIDRTNPNAKWDWWVVGGRWTGYFKLKPGASGETGRPGLMTPDAKIGYADSARKGDIDFEAMRQDYISERLVKFRLFHQTVAGRAIPNWTEIRERHGDKIDDARKEWRNHPVNKDLDALPEHPFFMMNDNEFSMGEGEFIELSRDSAISTFAVLHNGKWFEKGEMGWWACVTDEKDERVWAREFNALLDTLPDEMLLTVVDCHI